MADSLAQPLLSAQSDMTMEAKPGLLDRLTRLETELFGEASSGALADRISAVEAAVSGGDGGGDAEDDSGGKTSSDKPWLLPCVRGFTHFMGASKKAKGDKIMQGDAFAAVAALVDLNDLDAVKKKLANDYGPPDMTSAEEKVELDNDECPEKFQEFVDLMYNMNMYTYAILVFLDPTEDVKRFSRQSIKVFIVPVLQILMPLWILKEQVVDENASNFAGKYCPDVTNLPFRFSALVLYVYSVWSVIDGLQAQASTTLMKMSVQHFAITGRWPNLVFSIGWVTQLISGILLVVSLYFQMVVSETVMDLLFSCFGINFLIDVDTDLITEDMIAQGQRSAQYVFGQWRDACVLNEGAVRVGMTRFPTLRRNAEKANHLFIEWSTRLIAIFMYLIGLYMTFCWETQSTDAGSGKSYDYYS